jgi:hypothetical protein
LYATFWSCLVLKMPHEITNLETPTLMSTHPNIKVNREINRTENKGSERAEMITKIKENSVSEAGTVKVPIPEHIYDFNSKTFYKLGEFLGKVTKIYDPT